MRTALRLVGIDIKQLQASGVEPGCNYVGKPFQHLVAEIVIFLAFRAQAIGVKNQSACRLQRSGVKVPVVWRRNPGPAKNLATTEGLYRGGASVLDHEFHGNEAFANEVELVGRIAFGEHNVLLGKRDVLGAPSDEVQMLVRQSVEKRMFLNHQLQCLNHDHRLLNPQRWRDTTSGLDVILDRYGSVRWRHRQRGSASSSHGSR